LFWFVSNWIYLCLKVFRVYYLMNVV